MAIRACACFEQRALRRSKTFGYPRQAPFEKTAGDGSHYGLTYVNISRSPEGQKSSRAAQYEKQSSENGGNLFVIVGAAYPRCAGRNAGK